MSKAKELPEQNDQANPKAASRIPDATRRKMLLKLGAISVAVPAAVVLLTSKDLAAVT